MELVLVYRDSGVVSAAKQESRPCGTFCNKRSTTFKEACCVKQKSRRLIFIVKSMLLSTRAVVSVLCALDPTDTHAPTWQPPLPSQKTLFFNKETYRNTYNFKMTIFACGTSNSQYSF